MIRLIGSGVGLTAAVTGIFWLIWGYSAVLPSITFGTLATAIQVAAVAAVRPVWSAPYQTFLGRWALGMGLRLAGVVAIVIAVAVDRELYPPLPTALAYLGVLVPLLFTETRFLGDTRNTRTA